MSHSSPIGIIDSGIGCFTVLRALRQLMPQENWLVLQDQAYAPYGQMSDEQIIRRTTILVSKLQDLGVKAVVLACHSSSALAADFLRERFSIPIIDLLKPTVIGLVNHFQSQKILWLATEASVRANKLPMFLKEYGFLGDVIPVACPGWVEIIEASSWDGEDFRQRVQDRLNLGQIQADTTAFHVLLGCTHYPWARSVIQSCMDPRHVCIDPADWVAPFVLDLLRSARSVNTSSDPGYIKVLDKGEVPFEWKRVCELDSSEILSVA